MKRPWMLPLVPLYGAAVALRAAGLRSGLPPLQRLRWPVISIGNLSVGGTGKTPFTIALTKLLAREGQHVDVLSRGYGRKNTEIARVDPGGTAEEYGDEPLLMARRLGIPVYVGASRWRAGRMAEREADGASGVHLLDDGFQHRSLARQVDIVLVNSEDLADSLLPAGNLREGVESLSRASVIAVPAGDDEAAAGLARLGFGLTQGQQLWRFRRQMVTPPVPESLAALPVVAFCGIARPQQFFLGLTQKGVKVAVTRAFPDHHAYTLGDVEMLRRLAGSTGAGAMMTTAKDLYRMGSLSAALDAGAPILAADLEVTLENEADAMMWLLQRLGLAPLRREAGDVSAPA
jgi:tetraacyldisaccharide 4'-kinase